jgi:hypothetical protein
VHARLIPIYLCALLLRLDTSAPAAAEEPSETAEDVGLRRVDAALRASGSLTGTLQRLEDGWLIVRSFGPPSGEENLRVDATTPVFLEGALTGPGDLTAGMSVRVHYQDGSAGRTVVSVDVLDATTTEAVRREELAPVPRMTELPDAAPDGHPFALLPAHPLACRPAHRLVAAEYRQKEALLRRATGSQTGEVLLAENGYLLLKPFRPGVGGAREKLRLRSDVPVYQAGEQLTVAALLPGTDVRAYYKTRKDGLPDVLAVQVLTPEEMHGLEAR